MRPTNMHRRHFLELSAAGLAGGALAGCTQDEAIPEAASHGAFGDAPAGHLEALLPKDKRPEAIMEVFMGGGISPWDSFYVVPEYGDPKRGGPHAGQQWWCFQEDKKNSPAKWFDRCGGGTRPLLEPWRLDAAGKMVNLGPWLYRLRERPDMLARMRVLVMHHDTLPHHAAIPLALSGVSRNSPRMAVLGTHINRYFQDHAVAPHPAPHSYVIYQSSLDINGNADAASSVGLHRGSARQMEIRLGGGGVLAAQLARSAVAGKQAEVDALIAHYTQQYGSRIGAPGVRAPAVTDFAAVRAAMSNNKALQSLISPEVLAFGNVGACGDVEMPDQTTTGLKLATHLITSPNQSARYVNVFDGGLYPDPAGLGYDTHWNHVSWMSRNLTHMLDNLLPLVNEPGENDPRKIDLDKHLLILNNEFGRTPYREVSTANPEGTGTNHWAAGYVTIMFGGPVGPDQSGVAGAIGEDATALYGFTPAEQRAGILLSMGIWPFAPEAFRVSDVRDAKNELDAAMRLRALVLGHSV